MRPPHFSPERRPEWRARSGWLALLAIACVTSLRAPSLDAGLLDDDFIQLAMLRGDFPIERSPLDLFWFSGRNATEEQALIAQGYHPWWAHPELRMGMLRPFASALIAAEHALGLGERARHALSLACLVLCVWLAWRLLARVLPARIAAVACVLYAIDESFTAPAGWLANRNTLVSTALAWVALTSYVRVREQGVVSRATRLPWLGVLVLMLLTFVSGEYGFFVLGYVAAYELMQRSARDERAGPRARDFRALGSVVGVAALVAALSALGGYGVRNSGFYISPFHDPVRFGIAAFARLPALIADLSLGIPARYVDHGVPLRELMLERQWIDAAGWHALPSYRLIAGLLALPIVAALVWVTRAVTRRPELSALRWLVLGAALSIVPSAAALPGPRLTCGAALGIAALVATLFWQLFDHVRTGSAATRSRMLAVIALVGVALVHALLPMERAHAEANGLVLRSRAAERWALRADIPKDLTPDSQVWIVGASDFSTGVHVPWVRRAHGMPLIRRYRLLSGAGLAHDLRRIDDRTLEVQVLAANAGGGFAGTLYRPEDAPFRVGDRVALEGLRIEVIAVRAGDPQRFRLHTDRSLDDPSIVLLCPEPSGLRRCAMPPVGFLLRVPRAPLPWGDPRLVLKRTLRPL